MTVHWQELAQQFPLALVERVKELFDRPGSITITPEDLAAAAKTSVVDVTRLLDGLPLERLVHKRCSRCHESLDGIGERDTCPHCGTSFDDDPPETIVRYEWHRPPPRDVPWVLVLHGMNTKGTWQEELSWLISRSYRHMVPVAIYKYGEIRQGVFFRWRQRQLRDKVIAKIKVLCGQSDDAGYGPRPDVIAHSFGTWLIAHALQHDKDVRIGRLILLGSVVRPDFDWQSLIGAGQVEAVLNHGATRDEWVPLAQWFIPDAGAGGIHGFPSPVTNIAAQGFRHSDYFAPEDRMRSIFRSVWSKFLSWESVPAIDSEFAATAWKPKPAIMRFATRLFVMTLFWAIVLAIGTVFAAGIYELFF